MIVPAFACQHCNAHYHPDCWALVGLCSRCGSDTAEPIEVSILPLVALPHPRKALSIRPVDVLYIVGTHTVSGHKALRTILVILAAIPLLALFISALLTFFGSVLPNLVTVRATEGSIAPTAPVSVPTATIVLPTPTIPPTPTPIPTVVASGPGHVQLDDVNLRVAPDPNSESLAVLWRGTIVEIIGQPQSYEDTIWVKVQANGHEGWINQRYLRPRKPEVGPRARVAGTAPGQLRVRREPSLSAGIVDRISDGSEVELLPETLRSDDILWQHIHIDIVEGWVDSAFLQPIP
jgi:SH3-like domain-containing protein